MSGTDTASMVPTRYDVIVDGYGYTLWNALQPSLPFRTQRATYSYTPTFIERTNVSGAYGDNQQEFFLTLSQNDWSEGEGQLFFRGSDPGKSRQYFSGQAVDTSSIPGRAAVRPAVITANPAGSRVYAMCNGSNSDFTSVYYCSLDSGTVHLHAVRSDGTDVDVGAIGTGVVNQWGMCSDGKYVYMAGASKIQQYGGLVDFSAETNAGSIAFLNNSLYSCDGSVLKVYTGAGVATTLFTWKDATNTALTALAQTPKITAFGGQLLIYWQSLSGGPELWTYDGTSTHRVVRLPQGMVGYDVKVIAGIVYLSGLVTSTAGGVQGLVPVVYYWLNGTVEELWRSKTPVAGSLTFTSGFHPALGEIAGKLIILDQAGKRLLEYDPELGAVSNVAALTVSGSYASSDLPQVAGSGSMVLFDYDAGNSSTGNTLGLYPDASNYAASATLTSSLYDLDNSLTKVMRGVKVEWFGGGSVDISYLIDGDPATGSYTTLQATAVSGTEYRFPANTTGRAVSVRVKLNNSAGSIPTLARVYVRAAPVQQAFRRATYILDVTGDALMADPVVLRDGTLQTLTGMQMAAHLNTAITASAPISITDRLGTYTGVLEPGACELDEVRPGEFIAQLAAREV